MADSLLPHNGNNQNTTPVHFGYDKSFDKLIHDFFGNWFNLPTLSAQTELRGIEPKIEISETDNEMQIMAEVPGVAEKDMEIEISNDGYLTISGEKKSERNQKSKGSYFTEINYGSFKRTIPLPMDLKFDEAAADFDNGLVFVTIPKTTENQKKKRKISIKKK